VGEGAAVYVSKVQPRLCSEGELILLWCIGLRGNATVASIVSAKTCSCHRAAPFGGIWLVPTLCCQHGYFEGHVFEYGCEVVGLAAAQGLLHACSLSGELPVCGGLWGVHPISFCLESLLAVWLHMAAAKMLLSLLQGLD
jgi:hypothetical protein